MVPVTTNLIPEYFTSLLLGPFYTDGIISKGPSLSNLESVLGLIQSIWSVMITIETSSDSDCEQYYIWKFSQYTFISLI